jgi:hypothetical protein
LHAVAQARGDEWPERITLPGLLDRPLVLASLVKRAVEIPAGAEWISELKWMAFVSL